MMGQKGQKKKKKKKKKKNRGGGGGGGGGGDHCWEKEGNLPKECQSKGKAKNRSL